jgi:hypothetical protein
LLFSATITFKRITRKHKLEKMVRMSGLKSAAQIVAAWGTKMPFVTKVDKTLEAARKFKDYICQDDDFGMEPAAMMKPWMLTIRPLKF